MGHAGAILEFEPASVYSKIIYNLSLGGTTLFVFISGYLFHHVFEPRYSFFSFYKGKISRLFVPYLILGIVPILFRILTGNHPAGQFFFYDHDWVILGDDFTSYLKYTVTGKFALGYWYIPFAMLLYACAPFHFWFLKRSVFLQGTIIIILLGIASVLHRPSYYPQSLFVANLQSLVYFTPVYLFGGFCSAHRKMLFGLLNRRLPVLLLLMIALSSIQILKGDIGTYSKVALAIEGFDFMLFQKLVMCLFLLLFFDRLERLNHPLIALLATSSFAIYFIHGILYTGFAYLRAMGMLSFIDENAGLYYFPFVFSTIVVSIGIAILIRRLFPGISKYIIGY